MDERIEANQRRWDEMAALHLSTYNLAAEDQGQSGLAPFELSELGDLSGKRICRLQCHLGGDSMVLARHGATVVGVDFSRAAVATAQQRAAATGLNDRLSFVLSTVDEAREKVTGDFDVVYTSWGVLSWLPDVNQWARTVVSLLRPGGFLYLAESHPYAEALRWDEGGYGGAVAFFDESQGDYTDDDATFENPASWTWSHGLGETITALADAGLRIAFVHEHPIVVWHLNDADHLVKRADGMFEDPVVNFPLSYSLKATLG